MAEFHSPVFFSGTCYYGLLVFENRAINVSTNTCAPAVTVCYVKCLLGNNSY